MTNIILQQLLQLLQQMLFYQSNLFIKTQLKGAYPSTSFRNSSTLRIRRNTGRISKNVLIYLKKLYCHIYERKRLRLRYPQEQFSLIIIDTFKSQDNEEFKSLCLENNCELVIVPHSLTNKFQPFDLTINQKAKKFVSNHFNKWYAEKVSRQLKNGNRREMSKFP